MKIHVGSKNEVKINAVKDAILLYPKIFTNPEIVGVDVNVETFGHPKTIDETLQGSITRAKKAFQDSDYSIGIESGLMQVPYTNDGYVEVSTCAIYDGKQIYIGIGPAFEWPTGITKSIIEKGEDGSEAFKNLNYTKHEKLGALTGGICGYLTKGRLLREDQIKNSIIMAMIKLENIGLYR